MNRMDVELGQLKTRRSAPKIARVIAGAASSLLVAGAVTLPAGVRAQESISPATVETVLAGHGEWVALNGLGNAWRPSPGEVGPDFRPYATGGHWMSTEAGWVFANGYPGGEVTFHYGRWWRDRFYGWVWLPGTIWAPAWVTWRYSDADIGWSPQPPAGF